MIEIKNITKTYIDGKKEYNIFNNFSINFPSTGLVFISGRSGIGKTTLLNMISGMDKPTRGDIIVNGIFINKLNEKDLTKYINREVSLIFQDYNLFDELTVYENITILKSTNFTEDKIDNLLKQLNIYDLKNKKVYDLSGGEQQRVAILRALIKNSNIILCDEITSAIDKHMSIEIMNILKEISKEKLVILVSHDVKLVKEYADIIIDLENKENIKNLNIKDNEQKEEKVNNVLSKKTMFKLAMNSILISKKKLIFSFLLLIAAFFSLLISDILSNYDIETLHANAMINNNRDMVSFSVYDENDVDYIKSKINNKEKLQIGKSFINKNDDLELLKINYLFEYNNKEYAYYSEYLSDLIFFEINDYTFSRNQKYIGNIPTKENEIMITEYLADLLIHHGFINHNEFIKLDSYEELLNLDSLDLNGIDVKITGILKQNLEPYQIFKKITSYQSTGTAYKWIDNLFYCDIRYNKENIYITKDFYNLVRDYNEVTNRVYIIENNKDNLINIFKNFPIDNEDSTIMTTYKNSIKELKEILDKLANIFIYISIVIGLISLLIIINYIQNSIDNNKKNIFILKSLGIDTFKIKSIFSIEILIISLISYILSTIFASICCLLGNFYINKLVLFKINLLRLNLIRVFIIFVIIYLLCYLITFYFLRKINKLNPIYLNKNSL